MKKILLTIFLLLLSFNFCFAISVDKWQIEKFEVSNPRPKIGETAIIMMGVASGELTQEECVTVELWEKHPGNSKISATSSDGTPVEYKCCARPFGLVPTVLAGKEILAHDDIRTAQVKHKYKANCEFSMEVFFKEVPGWSGDRTELLLTIAEAPSIEKKITLYMAKSIPLPSEPPTDINVVTATSAIIFVEHIINIVFWLVSSFAFIMVVVGGFMMVTSGGEPRRVTRGRNTVFFAMAGFAIIAMSRGIVALIQAIMGVKQ